MLGFSRNYYFSLLHACGKVVVHVVGEELFCLLSVMTTTCCSRPPQLSLHKHKETKHLEGCTGKKHQAPASIAIADAATTGAGLMLNPCHSVGLLEQHYPTKSQHGFQWKHQSLIVSGGIHQQCATQASASAFLA